MRVESLDRVADEVRRAQSIAICGHRHPDGDCLGSASALAVLLGSMGKEVHLLLAGDEGMVGKYGFLPWADRFVPASSYRQVPDLFIAIDASNDERLLNGAQVRERARRSVVVDHHLDTEDFCDVSYSDAAAAACGVLVYELAQQLGLPEAGDTLRDLASACYVALVTDTGRFQFQNTDPRALACASQLCEVGADPARIAMDVYQNRTMASLRLEALVIERMTFEAGGRIVYSWVEGEDLARVGTTWDEAEELIDVVRSVQGAHAVLLMKIQGNTIRGSLRSKTDFDVREVAARFGGGGHRAAAGFTYHGTRKRLLAEMLPLLASA